MATEKSLFGKIMEPKFEYSIGNHYRWGWGDEWFSEPDPTKDYRIHLGYVTRPVQSFRQECITAVKYIAERATKPIIVGLSGGADSQMVCLALREAGIPYKAVILKLYSNNGDNYNRMDNANAYAFCKKFNVDYIEEHLNTYEYYHGGLGEFYARKYAISNIQTLVQMYVMDKVCGDYCYIMAGGDVTFGLQQIGRFDKNLPSIPEYPEVSLPMWYVGPQPIMRHMIEMGYEGTSKFYLYSPELIHSFMCDPLISDFIGVNDIIYTAALRRWHMPWIENVSLWWRMFNDFIKPMLMYREWPEMIRTIKFTGFERLDNAEIRAYQRHIVKIAAPLAGPQAVIMTMPELIDYISTPHTHSILASKVVIK